MLYTKNVGVHKIRIDADPSSSLLYYFSVSLDSTNILITTLTIDTLARLRESTAILRATRTRSLTENADHVDWKYFKLIDDLLISRFGMVRNFAGFDPENNLCSSSSSILQSIIYSSRYFHRDPLSEGLWSG